MDLVDWLCFDEEGRLRLPWRLFLFGIGFAVVVIGGSIATVVALLAWGVASGKVGRNPDLNQLQAAMADPFAESVVLSLILTPLLTVLVVICRRWLDRRPIRTLGLHWPLEKPGRDVFGGTLLGMFVIAIAAVVVWASGAFRFDVEGGSWQILLLTFALAPLAFMEEVVVRGYLLQNFLDARKPLFGIVFTSLVFWLLHGLNPHVWNQPLIAVNLVIAGIVLALAYMASGNLWFPTAVHFGWNLCQGPVLGIPVSGMDVPSIFDFEPQAGSPVWLSGGEFGLEGSLVVTIAQTVLAIGLWIWVKRKWPASGVHPSQPSAEPALAPSPPNWSDNPFAPP